MNSISKTDPSITELTKKIKELESNLENVNKEKEELFNTFHSLNLLTKNANALYTINDFDIQCKFNYVSPSVTKLAGYKPEEMIGKSAFDFVHPKDKILIVMPLMKTYLEYQAKKILMGELRDRSKTFYYRCLDKSGGWRYVETTSNLVGNQLIMVTIDVGEQKEWEKKLEQTKVDYKNLLDNLEDIYYRLNKDGIITDINPAIKKVSGFKQSEIIGKDVRKFFTDNEQRHGFIDSIKKNGIVKNYELDFIVKDGSKVYVSANAYIIKDDDGEPIGIEGILRNNTDWKLAETALVESEKSTKFLADSALELLECKTLKDITSYSVNQLYEIIDREGIVFIVDYDYATEFWEMQEFVGLKPYTKKLVEMLGFDISKMKGSIKSKYNLQRGKLKIIDDSITELTRGVVPKKLNNAVMRLISMDSLYCIPFQKDNEIHGNVTIITNPKTKPLNKLLIEAFISQVSTFYENIKIDKELSESKERYKALYESSTQAIAIANDKGQLLEANPEFLKLFRINDIDQLRELNPAQISPEYQPNGELSSKLIAGNIKNAIKKGFTHTDWIHKKLDGTEFPTIIEITKFFQGGEIFFQTSVIDLTNQIRAEEQFKDLVEKADIAISIEDKNGNFIYLNNTYSNIVGYAFEELKNKPVTMILHPDDSDRVMKIHNDRIAGKKPITDYYFKAITKDGNAIDLRIKANEIIENGIVVGTRSYIWDVTDKIKSQKALEESEKNMSFLANSVMDLSMLTTTRQIYKYLGKKLFELMGKSGYIAIVDFNNLDGTWEVRTLMGLPHKIEQVSKLLGINIKELKGKRDPKNVKYLKRGEYTQVKENISEFTQGIIPKNLIGKTAKLLNVKDVFTIPFMKEINIFGNVSFATTTRSKLLNKSLIETFISQVTTFLDKIKAQEDLKESEEKFSKSFRASPFIVGISTLNEGRFIEVNDAFEQFTGYSRKEIIGKTSTELKLWKDPQDRQSLQTTLKKHGRIKDLEIELSPKNGNILTTLFSAEILPLKGEPHIIAIVQDITEKKKAEKELAESENRFRLITDLTSDLAYAFIVHSNGEMTHLWTTGPMDKITGYAVGEITNIGGWDKLVHKNDMHIIQDQATALFNLKEIQVDYRVTRKDGKIIWVRDFARPIFNKKTKKVEKIYGSIKEITEQKKAEIEIQKLSTAVEQSPVTIVITDTLGQIEYVNPFFEQQTGYSNKEAIGLNPKVLKSGVHSDNFYKEMWDKINGGEVWSGEFLNKKKNGDLYWESATISPIKNESGKITNFIAIKKDITSNKNLLTELTESREMYQDLYDNAPDMYFSVSPQGIVLSVNEFGAKHLGYKKEELIGESVWIVVHPDDLKTVQSQIGKILKEKIPSSEIEFKKIRKDGTVLHVQERLQCLVDENNNCIELRINCRDITESKITQNRIIDYQRNLKSLSNALIVAEEKERKQLATALHDTVGQLLAITNIRLSTLENKLDKAENIKEISDVKKLVVDAIKESRHLTYELSPPILHELGLFAACKWYVNQLNDQHNIIISINGDENRYNISEEIKILIYRVTRELLNNIIKHADTSNANLTINKSNNYIKLIIQDEGVGFDANKLRETSIEGKKFGLFSITERIEYLGGSFDINSSKGEGTKITIKVPL